MGDALLQYLTERHASIQWRDFIEALIEELSAQLGDTGVNTLMAATGARFAARFPLGPCGTVADLERAIAQVWLDIDWGWTSISDTGDALLVQHHCAPRTRAEEGTGAPWQAAFLTGAYQHWFQSLGSSGLLQITQVSPFDATGSMSFRLGR
ncbi:cellulose biosynthesis protein BcsD [Cupriavidus oxalaticus]|uniref:Cellulose synthase n=1 Tax=Cupriavidus oxalaticus TaxID=96344 RepID=A0A5P3V9J9_9BURK|nr:cellulose biosynthesis protein BcsD [Cupriavidus oxalaticus]QEZ43027.1 cellulose synthase [Cupriavidus oxalaticus]